MQSDYGLTTTSRKVMKSPQSNPLSLKNIDEAKHMKRKYEQVKQVLNEQRQENFKLQQRLKQMQQMFAKRQRQIEKKDSIHDALLYQIKSLNETKSQSSLKSLSVQNSKSSYNNLSGQNDKRRINQINFSTTSEQSSKDTSIQKIGGHFAKVFQLNNIY